MFGPPFSTSTVIANGIQAELLIICVVPTMASKPSIMELWKCVKPQYSQTRVANQMPQNQTANPSSQIELTRTIKSAQFAEKGTLTYPGDEENCRNGVKMADLNDLGTS